MMLLTGQVWVSPGQWGNVAFFAFLMACLGGLVVNRAARSDVTFAFIAFYMTLVFGRSLWLGEPLAIPLHRLQSGALLLFTFFMISDPRTTPNSRAGGSCSPCSWRTARGTSSSGCSGPTACCGRWRSSR